MANSSSNKSCTHCKDSSSDFLMNGWICSTGYAQLCHRCFSIYMAGQFCETFHSAEDGWRDCNSCRKLIHCGCIVSRYDFTTDDLGGITCSDCSRFLLTQTAQSGLDLLFVKVMTATDANYEKGRIRIPKKHATEYFPEVSKGQVVQLNILDTDGKEWDLYYSCWVQGKHKTYVLYGLKDFMISKNFQSGNTVAFYRRRSDEKMIIELRRTSAATRTRRASTSHGK